MTENSIKPRVRRDGPHPAGRDDIQLPLVIRPVPWRLQDVERRSRTEPGFAQALRQRPESSALLARALWLRDQEARRRFGDVRALAAWLQQLAIG